jgi:hypothetical protein
MPNGGKMEEANNKIDEDENISSCWLRVLWWFEIRMIESWRTNWISQKILCTINQPLYMWRREKEWPHLIPVISLFNFHKHFWRGTRRGKNHKIGLEGRGGDGMTQPAGIFTSST